MSATVDREAVHTLLCGACGVGEGHAPFSPLTTLPHSTLRQRFTFLFPSLSNLYSLLDVAKVCVCVCVLHDACFCACSYVYIIE